MAKGRKPLADSYICNLNDLVFEIACREQPSKGTEIEVVVPVKQSVTYEQMDNMIFLLDNAVYQTVPPNIYKEVEPLKTSTMRRNFYIYDSFRGDKEVGWAGETVKLKAPEADHPIFISYYWRFREEKNSAFRR